MTEPDRAPRSPAFLSWLYGAALLLGALLLFWIQPLFTRMALPLFGGAPAVWTTASMFFQFALLAGYLYAHLLSRSLEFRRQVFVHLASQSRVPKLHWARRPDWAATRPANCSRSWRRS